MVVSVKKGPFKDKITNILNKAYKNINKTIIVCDAVSISLICYDPRYLS